MSRTKCDLKDKSTYRALMIVFFISTIYLTLPYINSKTQVSIKCDKNTNTCYIFEKKIILPDNTINFSSSNILFAENKLLHCYRGDACSYSLQIHMKDGNVITTYYGSIDEQMVNLAANRINEYINSANNNLIVNSPHYKISIMEILIAPLIFPLIALVYSIYYFIFKD